MQSVSRSVIKHASDDARPRGASGDARMWCRATSLANRWSSCFVAHRPQIASSSPPPHSLSPTWSLPVSPIGSPMSPLRLRYVQPSTHRRRRAPRDLRVVAFSCGNKESAPLWWRTVIPIAAAASILDPPRASRRYIRNWAFVRHTEKRTDCNVTFALPPASSAAIWLFR